MRLLKETFGVLGALVVIAVIVAFVAPRRTHALVAALVQIVPGTTTQVGQNESQLVSLLCANAQNFCVANDPSGNQSTSAYVIPSGYTLIVTDYQWFVHGGTPGAVADDRVLNTAGPHLVLIEATGAIADISGNAVGHDHFTTGIRVGSGVTISDLATSAGQGFAELQGYLVPND
jgi:hypothetical protein